MPINVCGKLLKILGLLQFHFFNPLTPIPGIYQVYGCVQYHQPELLGKTMSYQIDPQVIAQKLQDRST
jgi:hypothetical protein